MKGQRILGTIVGVSLTSTGLPAGGATAGAADAGMDAPLQVPSIRSLSDHAPFLEVEPMLEPSGASSADGQPESPSPQDRPQASAPRLASLRVDLFLPRPLVQADAPYLLWISGAANNSQAVLERWIATVNSLDAEWRLDLFADLRPMASHFARLHSGGLPTGDGAKALRELMTLRHARAALLLEREKDVLVQVLAESEPNPDVRAAIAARVARAREADAIESVEGFSFHLRLNMLRHLHELASDSSLSPEWREDLRSLALGHAASLIDLRLTAIGQCLDTSWRGLEEVAHAIERGGRGTGVPPMAKVFRPLLATLDRIGSLHEQILDTVRTTIDPAIADRLRDLCVQHTYGPLAIDPWSWTDIQAALMDRIGEDDLDAARESVRLDAQHRHALRAEMLAAFDRCTREHLSRGLQRDPQSTDRFVRTFVRCHRDAERSAREAMAFLRSLAGPDSLEDDEIARWSGRARQRLSALIGSGALSTVVPEESLPTRWWEQDAPRASPALQPTTPDVDDRKGGR